MNDIFVDYTAGNDGNDGSFGAPLKTIAVAMDLAIGRAPATINLRQGNHFVTEPILFQPGHKGLTIQNYNGSVSHGAGGEGSEAKRSEAKRSRGPGSTGAQPVHLTLFGGPVRAQANGPWSAVGARSR